jgi:hypothetical protein
LQIQALERTVCTGSASEMRTAGGEVAFVCAMIADSIQLRDRSVRDGFSMSVRRSDCIQFCCL